MPVVGGGKNIVGLIHWRLDRQHTTIYSAENVTNLLMKTKKQILLILQSNSNEPQQERELAS